MNLIDIVTDNRCHYCNNEAVIFIILKGSGRAIPLCSYHSIDSFSVLETGEKELKNIQMEKSGEKDV